MDSDEEETFICIGNPVEQVDGDAPLKKPVFVQDLKVKDIKGRQRFHGAFTGGFSAGYFNSVGSKDGFTPTEFVSSRDKKIDSVKQHEQRPEDFMDDEDFGEHGIAPRKLVTSEKFSTEEGRKRRHDEGKAMLTGTVFEGTSALTDFIIPEKLTIGLKLLKKLGWKQGHGIGSRRKPQKEPERKIYGCSLPSQSTEEESDEELQFGPKDVNPISFNAKDNIHGLGYSGLNPKSALPGSHINLFEPPAITKTGRKGIRGQAFGVGALEDADDDIYSTDHMSNYDMTMEIEDPSNLHGWTAPKSKHEFKQLPIGYVGKILEGFKLSDKPLNQKKVFTPPDLPRHFKPVHVFQKPADSDVVIKQTEQTAVTRGLALGEVESVFDLIPSKDKEKMKRIRKEGIPSNSSVVQERSAISMDSTQHLPGHSALEQQLVPVHADSTNQPHNPHTESSAPKTSVPLFSGSLSYKPFAKNEKKQAKYEKYLNLVKQGKKDAYEEVTEGHMTEWEREREKEEFIRAAKLYKPLAGMIATRFTRAKFEDSVDTVDVPLEEKGDKDDRTKAAEMKMYGKLTRDEFEWHPDRLLCKRFNVSDPYPGSSIVGLPTVKRDKYSVYNFLTFPSTDIAESPDLYTAGSNESSHTSTTHNVSVTGSQQQETSKSHDKPTKSHDISVSSKPVSIFSHLVKPEKQKQSETRPQEKNTAKPKSIFSHLVEDKKGHSSKEVVSETVEQEKKQEASVTTEEASEEKSPMDLFSAIFGNTDSEGSDEEEKTEIQTKPESTEPRVSPPEDTHTTKEPQYLPGGPVVMETIEERLSPKVSEETSSYGPLPPNPSVSTSSVTSSLVSSKDYLNPTGQEQHSVMSLLYTEKTKGGSEDNSHRKQKHSKHKHKKDKKSKHKKSKHKKKEKKKKKRYSDSEEDSSSDEEEEVPTDRELLQKLKTLPKGKYLI